MVMRVELREGIEQDRDNACTHRDSELGLGQLCYPLKLWRGSRTHDGVKFWTTRRQPRRSAGISHLGST